MAVTVLSFSESYVSDGSTLAFPVPFPFLEYADLLVSVKVGATETFLTYGPEFFASGANTGTGTVTLRTAVPAGSVVKITRVVPITQLIDFRTQGPFSPEMWEYAADKLTMICQQISGGLIDVREIIGGEINTGQNVNVGGHGVFEQKVGQILQFRGVRANSGKIAVTYNAATKTINVDLGTVGPGDVGAAPASIVNTVNNHTSQINLHESWILQLLGVRPVSARAEYMWDGGKYVRQPGAYDPNSILPDVASPTATGRASVIFREPLPTTQYRAVVTTSTAIDGTPAYACWQHPKSDTVLALRFQFGETAKHVSAFSLLVDWETTEK